MSRSVSIGWKELLASFGLALGILGFINLTWVDFSLTLLLGLGNGYVTIILFTWIQTRTPKTMLWLPLVKACQERINFEGRCGSSNS